MTPRASPAKLIAQLAPKTKEHQDAWACQAVQHNALKQGMSIACTQHVFEVLTCICMVAGDPTGAKRRSG